MRERTIHFRYTDCIGTSPQASCCVLDAYIQHSSPGCCRSSYLKTSADYHDFMSHMNQILCRNDGFLPRPWFITFSSALTADHLNLPETFFRDLTLTLQHDLVTSQYGSSIHCSALRLPICQLCGYSVFSAQVNGQIFTVNRYQKLKSFVGSCTKQALVWPVDSYSHKLQQCIGYRCAHKYVGEKFENLR